MKQMHVCKTYIYILPLHSATQMFVSTSVYPGRMSPLEQLLRAPAVWAVGSM